MLFVSLLAVSVVGQSAEIHSAHSGSRAVTALDSCVDNPLQTNCSSFQYPLTAAAEDLNKLCSAMHFMSACSVAKACNASGAGPDNPTGPGAAEISSNNPDICQPFNQVATVCKLDKGMSRMSGECWTVGQLQARCASQFHNSLAAPAGTRAVCLVQSSVACSLTMSCSV